MKPVFCSTTSNMCSNFLFEICYQRSIGEENALVLNFSGPQPFMHYSPFCLKNQITILNREGCEEDFSNILVMGMTLTLKSAS